MRDGYNKTPNLLEAMPGSACEVAAWFETLTDLAFDTVCVSAVTVILTEEQEETGFISATSIARCTRAVRERYRRMSKIEAPKPQVPDEPLKRRGTTNGMARMTEMQVRVARRVDRQVRNCDLAEIFDVHTTTVAKARSGATWRHLTNGSTRG